MGKYAVRALGAGCVCAVVTNAIYGGSATFNMGPAGNFPVELLTRYLPVILGVLYPLLQSRLPWLADIIKALRDYVRTNRDSIDSILDKLSELEMDAANRGDDEALEYLAEVRSIYLDRECCKHMKPKTEKQLENAKS